MDKEKSKPTLTNRLDAFLSRVILNKIEEKKGEESRAYKIAMWGSLPVFLTTAALEKTLWTRTDSKFKNIAVATLKSIVAYKVALLLGSSMELEIIPTIPEIPNLSEIPESIKEQKDMVKDMWENRAEFWEYVKKIIRETTLSEVMQAISERGKFKTFLEVAATSQWASSVASTGKLLKKGSTSYVGWIKNLEKEISDTKKSETKK